MEVRLYSTFGKYLNPSLLYNGITLPVFSLLCFLDIFVFVLQIPNLQHSHDSRMRFCVVVVTGNDRKGNILFYFFVGNDPEGERKVSNKSGESGTCQQQ